MQPNGSFSLGRGPSRVTPLIVRMRNSELCMHAEEGSMHTQKWGFYDIVLYVSCIASSLPGVCCLALNVCMCSTRHCHVL